MLPPLVQVSQLQQHQVQRWLAEVTLPAMATQILNTTQMQSRKQKQTNTTPNLFDPPCLQLQLLWCQQQPGPQRLPLELQEVGYAVARAREKQKLSQTMSKNQKLTVPPVPSSMRRQLPQTPEVPLHLQPPRRTLNQTAIQNPRHPSEQMPPWLPARRTQ